MAAHHVPLSSLAAPPVPPSVCAGEGGEGGGQGAEQQKGCAAAEGGGGAGGGGRGSEQLTTQSGCYSGESLGSAPDPHHAKDERREAKRVARMPLVDAVDQPSDWAPNNKSVSHV